MNDSRKAQSLYSSFYERMVEHVFISEVLQECWFGFGERVEVLRSEVDSAGYDLVLDCNGVIRHLQLKTSEKTAKTATQNVNIALATKPSGCVVWMLRESEAGSSRMKLTYRFFGAGPRRKLPPLDEFKVGRHAKANAEGYKAERPAIRVIPKGRFEVIESTRELVGRLFGLNSTPHHTA